MNKTAAHQEERMRDNGSGRNKTQLSLKRKMEGKTMETSNRAGVAWLGVCGGIDSWSTEDL